MRATAGVVRSRWRWRSGALNLPESGSSRRPGGLEWWPVCACFGLARVYNFVGNGAEVSEVEDQLSLHYVPLRGAPERCARLISGA